MFYKNSFFLPDNVRISAAYYIGTEKKQTGPQAFVYLAISAAICMVLSESIARIKRKKISPVQATNSNNMVISNLIPFTNLNLIVAYDFVIITIIKVFGPIQTGVPNISVHSSAVLLLLVITNSEARSHFKRKMAT